MRVAMVLGRSTGGIGTHVAQLAGDLRRLGDDVRVVAHPETAARFDLGPSVAWWPVPLASPARLAAQTGAARQALRMLQRADVVHAHGHQAGLVAALLLAGVPSRRRPPLVVSWHNAVLGAGETPTWRDPRQLAQRLVARRAVLVTGASSDLVREAAALGAAAELAPVPSPRVPALLDRRIDPTQRAALRSRLLAEVLRAADPRDPPPPGDPDAPGLGEAHAPDAHASGAHASGANASGADALHKAPDDVPLVLTVCRIAPQKSLHLLVQAAAVLALSGPVRWVVVGDGDRRLLDELTRLAAELGAPVVFAGARSDVGDWLVAADLFVLTSTWEARALVVQEAMAASLPVVAYEVGGLPDLLDGVGLLLHPLRPGPDDRDEAAETLARVVRELLDDSARRAGLARRGRAAAEVLPTGAETARRWHARYLAVRAGPGP